MDDITDLITGGDKEAYSITISITNDNNDDGNTVKIMLDEESYNILKEELTTIIDENLSMIKDMDNEDK